MSCMSKFCVCIFLLYMAAVLIILPLMYTGLLGGKDCEEYECWINLLWIMFGMFASLVFLCVCCCLAAYFHPSEPDVANRIVFRSPDDATLNSPPDKSTREIGEEWISGQPWTFEPDSQRQKCWKETKSSGWSANNQNDLNFAKIGDNGWKEHLLLGQRIVVHLWWTFKQLPTSWNEWSPKLQQLVLWSTKLIKSDTW